MREKRNKKSTIKNGNNTEILKFMRENCVSGGNVFIKNISPTKEAIAIKSNSSRFLFFSIE